MPAAKARASRPADQPPRDATGTKSAPALQEVRERFITLAGNASQALGVGRVLGQIFAHVYLSPVAQTLDDLTRRLGISKGSASMAVRQLEQWGALRRVWVKGDRKDYYEANQEWGQSARRALGDIIAQRLESADALVRDLDTLLQGQPAGAAAGEEWAFVAGRIQRFNLFRERLQWMWQKVIQGILQP